MNKKELEMLADFVASTKPNESTARMATRLADGIMAVNAKFDTTKAQLFRGAVKSLVDSKRKALKTHAQILNPKLPKSFGKMR